MFGLIQRSIIIDLIKITALGLFGVSVVLMFVGAMFEATRKGIDPLIVVGAMPYLIPPTLPYTMPSCLLFACTVVYGRMSGGNEITALKAGGVHIHTIVAPALALSLVVASMGVYVVNHFIPACNRKFTESVLADLEATLYAYLKQAHTIEEPNFDYEIYVQDVVDDRLICTVIKHRDPNGRYDLIVFADEARLKVIPNAGPDGEHLVRVFLDGGVATLEGRAEVQFPPKQVEMPIPNSIRKRDDKIENLTFDGLRQQSRENGLNSNKVRDALAFRGTMAALNGHPMFFAEVSNLYSGYLDRFERKALETRGEVHLRLAQSTAAIPFVLLGCPVSILLRRREFLHTFFICFLPIVTIFYPMMILALNMVKEGTSHIVLTMWLPTALMSLIGLMVLRKTVQH